MKKVGYLAIIFAMTVWGLSYVSIKIALEVFTPVGLVFYRYIFATIFFILFMILKKEKFKFEKVDIPLFFISALIGVVLYFSAESNGIKYLSVSSASIILSLIPLVIMISNFFLHNERLNKIKIMTIFTSILGIYLIVRNDAGGMNSIKGYLFMLLAVICWVVFSETSSRLTKKYSELKVAATQAYIALFIYLPLIFFQDIDYTLVETHHWIHVIALGIISSAISFMLYVLAIKAIGATESSLFINFIPVVTIVFGYFILGDKLNTYQIIGAVIIIGSMTFMISNDLLEDKKKNKKLIENK